jgi:hypothetical protein
MTQERGNHNFGITVGLENATALIGDNCQRIGL